MGLEQKGPIRTLDDLRKFAGDQQVAQVRSTLQHNFRVFATASWPNATSQSHPDPQIRDMVRLYLAGAMDALNDVEPMGMHTLGLIFAYCFDVDNQHWDVGPFLWFPAPKQI